MQGVSGNPERLVFGFDFVTSPDDTKSDIPEREKMATSLLYSDSQDSRRVKPCVQSVVVKRTMAKCTRKRFGNFRLPSFKAAIQ